jgi:hypothetical protein
MAGTPPDTLLIHPQCPVNDHDIYCLLTAVQALHRPRVGEQLCCKDLCCRCCCSYAICSDQDMALLTLHLEAPYVLSAIEEQGQGLVRS